MSKETKVIKEQESNKFVIDNSGLILLCEVSHKDDDSEWGKTSFVKVVGEFDSVDEAEAFADEKGIALWGEIKDWNLDIVY